MNDIKVIFLDWHNTICINVFWEHLNKNGNKDIFEKITDAVFINDKNLVQNWMCGKINTNDVIKIICKNKDLDEKFVIENLFYSSRNMQFISPNIPNIIEKIKAKNIRIVLASDNMDIFENTIKILNLNDIFDDILLSNKIGFTKDKIFANKSLFFDDYISKNNYKYNDCILIDDSKILVEICKIIGMKNILVENCKDDIESILKQFV